MSDSPNEPLTLSAILERLQVAMAEAMMKKAEAEAREAVAKADLAELVLRKQGELLDVMIANARATAAEDEPWKQ